MTTSDPSYDDFLAEFNRCEESWYAHATTEDLVLQGVVPRFYVKDHPVPSGMRAIDHFTAAGMIQSYSTNISITCAIASLPLGVPDDIAVGWIMKASGGKADPESVRKAICQRGDSQPAKSNS